MSTTTVSAGRVIRDWQYASARLMSVPPPQVNAAAERAVFARLRILLEELNASGRKLDTLSMGMSGDYRIAVEEGATLVRVGTAIFGERRAK